MLVDDAKKLAAAIEEAINSGSVAGQGITTTIKSDELQPKSIPAGAGRPTFRRYYIHVDDGTRMATLNLGQAGELLDEIEPDWGPDRLFDAIRALDVPVEDSPADNSNVDNSN
ncbi:MAG: hypothetical protein ACRDTE_32540 [Pseudonocardiaceae bacterium]